MNLVWIEDLLAIAESQSLTEAAARRHVTQPAFSRRVRAIEEHLGVTLVDRSRRPVRPTGAVLERVDLFRRLASGLRQLPQDLAASGSLADRRVVIACQHALSISVAPGLARRVLESVEGATVRLRSANRDECLALLMTRQANLLVALETDDLQVVADEDFVEKEHLADECLVAVAAPGSAAAVWTVDSPFDLPLIAYPDSVFLGAVMARRILPSIALRGRHVRVVETALTLAARELAIAGIGAAWIPESLVRQDLDQGRLVHLPGAFEGCVLALVVLRLRTPPSRTEDIAWTAITRRDAAVPMSKG